MTLKKNIVANYVGQIYVTVIGIIFVPIYIKYMGAEAYGLVGFFAMLQVWFNLLDIGLSSTIARETARFNGGLTDVNSYRNLVRALEGFFLIVGLIGGAVLYFGSGYIAEGWLKAMQLQISEIQTSLEIMSIIIVLRWMCGLYRGIISGSERLVWLSGFNSLINTMRFVGVIPIILFISITPIYFFSFQLLIAVIEFFVLVYYSYALLPKLSIGKRVVLNWISLKPVLNFSLTIAFTSSLWVLVTQIDKLVLSRLLTLADYGYYSLAVIVAGSVLIISSPIGTVLMPRMAKMEAENNHAELIELYRKATQFVCVVALPVACTLAVFAEQVLWVWTGDKVIATSAASVLQLYVVGNAVLAVSAFPYYLQYAKGNLRLHLIGSVLFTLLLLPSLLWGTLNYGAVGAGWAWVVSHIIFFLLWIPFIHGRFEPGLHLKWLFNDIVPIVSIVVLFTLMYSTINFGIQSRALLSIYLILLGLVMLIFASLGTKAVRIIMKNWIKGLRHARI